MERNDDILPITLSGIRAGEDLDAKALLSECDLHTADITDEMLRDFLVARKGDRIVGVIGLEMAGRDALLRSLAVTEKFRSQGVGAMLVEAIQRYARCRRLTMLYLLTLTAEGFFTRQGFARTARDEAPGGIRATREFQSLCPVTAVCMCKPMRRVD
jgi:amino-acid N-acetyltransferase